MTFAVALCIVMGAATAASAQPLLEREFVSSSRRTVVQYYRHRANGCGGPAGVNCDFHGVIPTRRAGYSVAEVFLTGFRYSATTQSARLGQLYASVRMNRYDAATGDLDVSVSAGLRTEPVQTHEQYLGFAVVLTSRRTATFTRIGTGCSGTGSCSIVRSLPSAVPFGQQYIGLGTQMISIASPWPVDVNTLSAHINHVALQPSGAVDVDYGCHLRDARASNSMWCEWGAATIAFDPREMDQHGGPLFPQYTMLNWSTTNHDRVVNQVPHPAGASFPGFLDLLEGFSFQYNGGAEYPIWQIDALADRFDVLAGPPDLAQSRYHLFFGDQFGNTATASPYLYQYSRAFGFLR